MSGNPLRAQDPLGVRASAEFVAGSARSVSLDERAIAALCARFGTHLIVPGWNQDLHFGDGTARTANYILLLDALNFSFWGEPRWSIAYRGRHLDGYWALAAALKRAIEDGIDLTDAVRLSALETADLALILRGDGEIPLLAERAAHAREVGRVLQDRFQRQCTCIVEEANFDAPALAGMVVDHFPSFRDEATYLGRRVQFYKRAQIFAADLSGAYGGQQWGALSNLAALTAFADYKLPQILRQFGILQYASALARTVDAQVEIPMGAEEEVEIRAATIVAVERIRAGLQERGMDLTSVQIDWALWEAAQAMPPGSKPYHLTRTVCY